MISFTSSVVLRVRWYSKEVAYPTCQTLSAYKMDPRDDPSGAEGRNLSQLAIKLLSKPVTQRNEQSLVSNIFVLRLDALVFPLSIIPLLGLWSTTRTIVYTERRGGVVKNKRVLTICARYVY